MDTKTEKPTKTSKISSELARLPEQANPLAIQEQIANIRNEAQNALAYAYEQFQTLSGVADEESALAIRDNFENALAYVDQQILALQEKAQEGQAREAALIKLAEGVIEQRDLVADAYKRAFEHGVLHAFECDACMEEARVENLANTMMETSPDEVWDMESEALEERLNEAHELYEEWTADTTDYDPGQDKADRTALLGLIDARGGWDIDNVEYDSQVIEADQELVDSITGEDSGDVFDQDGE